MRFFYIYLIFDKKFIYKKIKNRKENGKSGNQRRIKKRSRFNKTEKSWGIGKGVPWLVWKGKDKWRINFIKNLVGKEKKLDY